MDAVVRCTLAGGQRTGNGERGGRRKNQRRRPERHPRAVRHARARSTPSERRLTGGGRQRGRGHRPVCYAGKVARHPARKLALQQAQGEREYTVGVLAQTNFGGNLTSGGVPIFRSLQPPNRRTASAGAGGSTFARPEPVEGRASADGSCMLVVATDAPLDARDLRRLAARAVFGPRHRVVVSNACGDFASPSTSPEVRSRFNETAARAHTTLPTEATSCCSKRRSATRKPSTTPCSRRRPCAWRTALRKRSHRSSARATEALTNAEPRTTNDQRLTLTPMTIYLVIKVTIAAASCRPRDLRDAAG